MRVYLEPIEAYRSLQEPIEIHIDLGILSCSFALNNPDLLSMMSCRGCHASHAKINCYKYCLPSIEFSLSI